MEENEVMAIEMRLTLPALRILLDSIETTLKNWPGGNAEDQLAIVAMRNLLQAAVLELLYDSD